MAGGRQKREKRASKIIQRAARAFLHRRLLARRAAASRIQATTRLALARFAQGDVLLEAGRYAEASVAYASASWPRGRARRLRRCQHEMVLAPGRALFRQQLYEPAANAFSAEIPSAPDAACESTLYANVALCRLKTREPSLALSAADMSLKADLGNEKARYHRARAYELLGMSINALRDYAAVNGKEAGIGRRRLEKKLSRAADALANIKFESMTPTSMQMMNDLQLKYDVRRLHIRTSHQPQPNCERAVPEPGVQCVLAGASRSSLRGS